VFEVFLLSSLPLSPSFSSLFFFASFFASFFFLSSFFHWFRYARENGCKWDEDTCANAAKAGRLDILKYGKDSLLFLSPSSLSILP